MKYGVPQSQWNEMASYNEAEQMNRFGITRARLMELALTTNRPEITPPDPPTTAVQQTLDMS